MKQWEYGEPNSNEKFEGLLARYTRELFEVSIEQVVSYLADRVANVNKDFKLISLIGGEGAGKSILAALFSEVLNARGIAAGVISTDDFLVGTREERRALEREKRHLAKYDFGYMNDRIEKIRERRGEVVLPTYNEATGIAVAEGEENYAHKIGEIDCLIVEGNFDEVKNPDLRIYLHATDKDRFRARINRDLRRRGETDRRRIEENFQLRQRQQHFPFTLPAIERAEIIVHVMPRQDGYKYSAYEFWNRDPEAD